jgi:hypothetical protein
MVNSNALHDYITYSAFDPLPVNDSFPWLDNSHHKPYSASSRVIRDRDNFVSLVREAGRVLDCEIDRPAVVLGEY